jgi:uncharacterized protein YaeQ
MNNRLFISYSHADEEIVHKVADELLRKNFKIWIDRDNIQVGRDENKQIKTGVESSKVFICFISENYCKSQACKKELHLALRNKNNIFLIMLVKNATEGVEIHINRSMTMFYAYKDGMKFEPWSQNLFNNLVKNLTDLLTKVNKISY